MNDEELVSIRHVFLDAEVFVRHGFNSASRSMRALVDFAVNKRLVVIVTDVVRLEIAQQINIRVEEAWRLQKPLLQKARLLASSRLESARGLIRPLNKNEVVKDLVSGVDEFLDRCSAITVKGSSADLGQILNDYFARKAPFDTENRKAEFPDAISVSAIARWAAQQGIRAYVVSADKGVVAACAAQPQLRSVQSLESLLGEIHSFNDAAAAAATDWLLLYPEPVASEIKRQFEDLAFFVEDDDGDIDVLVTKVSFDDVEVIEIEREEAVAVVSCTIQFDAEIVYPDPDAQARDSETGEVITFRHLTVIQKEDHDGYAEVRLRLDRDGRLKFSVVSVDLTEPFEAIGVAIRHHHLDHH